MAPHLIGYRLGQILYRAVILVIVEAWPGPAELQGSAAAGATCPKADRAEISQLSGPIGLVNMVDLDHEDVSHAFFARDAEERFPLLAAPIRGDVSRRQNDH